MSNITLTLNIERLNYLLDFYNLSLSNLVEKLNQDSPKRKNPILETNIISEDGKIKLSLLKKIDKIFSKGLTYYVDSTPPVKTNETSIFFRKKSFNSELTFESKKIVNLFEEQKFAIQNLLANLDLELDRKLKKYSLSDFPKDVAFEIRDLFGDFGKKSLEDRKFLLALIRKIEDFNVFVFEYVEPPVKKEKVNFEGFFVKPNLIILSGKKYLKREIFTLVHEFAHYLLDDEEIDSNVGEFANRESQIENWCNEFAYSFLARDYLEKIEELKNFSEENNFHEDELEKISKKTKLSTLSLYTHFVKNNKISQEDYNYISDKIKKSIQEQEKKAKEEFEAKKMLAEERGEKLFISPRKSIPSKLFADILKMNYYQGEISKPEICKYLRINENKLGDILYA